MTLMGKGALGDGRREGTESRNGIECPQKRLNYR